MLQPNDLPLVCLPLDLSDEAAAKLIEFLHELTEALERHYGAQLKRHYDAIARAQRADGSDDSVLIHRTRSPWASASGESALTPNDSSSPQHHHYRLARPGRWGRHDPILGPFTQDFHSRFRSEC